MEIRLFVYLLNVLEGKDIVLGITVLGHHKVCFFAFLAKKSAYHGAPQKEGI